MSLSVPATVAPSLEPPAGRRPRWPWWVGGFLLLLAGLALAVHFLLDPWLRRQAEQQVARRTHGRYQLQLGALHTSLWRRTLTLHDIRLRPSRQLLASDSLAVQLAAARLRVAGIGLWDLVRRRVVPIDSIVLQAPHLRLRGHLLPSPDPRPLHQRLPQDGLRIAHLAVQDARAIYRRNRQDSVAIGQARVIGQDVLLSAAGALDTQRVAYAAAWQLQAAQARASGLAHQLRLGRLTFSTRTGQLRLDSLGVQPLVPVSARRTPGVRVSLVLPTGTLTGLRARPLSQGTFRADTLRLQRPTLALTLPAVPPPPVYEVLADVFPRFQLSAFAVDGGQVRIGGLERAPQARQVRILGQQLRIDKAAAAAPDRILYARSWEVRTGPGSVLFDAPFYRLSYQQLALSTVTRSLKLSTLFLTPTMPLRELSQRKRHQISHIRVWAPRLQATGIDWGRLTRSGYWRAQELTLTRPIMRVAGDGRYPLNPNRSLVTPEQLRRLPGRFDLRRLRITGGNIWFAYRSPRSPQLGHVSITGLTGTFDNISNDPARVRMAPVAEARASAWFQQRSFVRATIRVPLLRADGRHTVTGSFGRAPFSILNPITVPGRSARFRSGTVEQVRFAFTADQRGVEGQMWARYSDLHLKLLTEHRDRGLKKVLVKAKSKLVDGLLIRNNNPRRPGQELKVGTIQSSRDGRLSVFAIWQQALISGMLHSLGVPLKIARQTSETSSAPATMPAPGTVR
ncbi:hypothetical protein LRS06_16050 [Hymenobacter sp. J193]|uniref:hypothetical protein n=1 Tax=Hymenobacter sp. J193 TaxID=2898429 RepID=UPI002150DCA8|nr:hypothetical protein [Hymenobacter sp. J193]MCR5889250.1 hypothetical protein [Hymenobacter sp. J193]